MNKNERIYIDFHILQTVPPSCVNRDDTGSPKTAIYGGVTRARISSQAQKHAMRLMFKDIFEASDCGNRTKRIVGLIAEKIAAKDPNLEPNAENLAIEALKSAGLNIKNAEKGTDALFFISDAQAEALADLAIAGKEQLKDKKACAAALMATPSIDMALFGRMVASDPSLNYDACSQVAHAISTHTVQNEYDYFTAVDDLAADDNAGAAHLGTVEFNSSTMYRYATVNVAELAALIGKDTAKAVRGFAEAFICSMPTGKQNTFANRTLPDDVYVTIRRDQPINLSGAFESPVKQSQGYVAGSEAKLCEYAKKVYALYSGDPEVAYCIGDGLASIAVQMPMKQLLNELESKINTMIG